MQEFIGNMALVPTDEKETEYNKHHVGGSEKYRETLSHVTERHDKAQNNDYV